MHPNLTLRYSDILFVTLAWCLSWFIAGCAFFALVLALWPGTPLTALPICIGIYAIAWDFGFVTFITPSGLGFRELAIGVLFALALPTIPASLVAIIALLSRAVSTAAELLCVGAAYLSGGRQIRQIRQVQQEQATNQNPPSAEHAKEEEDNVPPIEASTNVMVEKGAVSE